MTTTTITVQPASRSHATYAPAGSIVTIAPGSGGTMMLEYSLSSQADIRNGVAVWNTWPGGTVSASTQNKANKNMYVRGWAYTAAGSIAVTDDPTPADLAAFTSDWGVDTLFTSPVSMSAKADGTVAVQGGIGVFVKAGGKVSSINDSKLLRQVANNCRYPNINFGLRQYFGMTLHTVGADVNFLRLGYLNAYGYQEIQGAGTLQIGYAIEYPIGRDDLQTFTFNGSELGQCAPGASVFTDGLQLDTMIPKGAQFKLWTYIYSTASGIPGSYSGPQPWVNGAATYGLSIQSGSNTTNIDYLFTQTTAAQRNALANNGTANGNVQITPLCILSNSTNKAIGIWGDSRFAGQSAASPWNFDYVSDASLKQCAGERVFGECAPWINLSASSDSMANMTTAGGGRRNEFLKFVTDVVNGLGTNDIDGAASDAVLQGYDAAFASMRYVQGKRLWGVTLPPKGTSSNQVIDLAGQTLLAGDTRRLNLNAWRKIAPIYTGGVLDYAAVVSDAATGKWKANGRQISGSITSGSSQLSGSGFTAAEDGKTIYVTGAGAAGAALIARQQYVNASTVNLVDPVTGLAVTAGTTVSGAVTYVNCREYTSDVLHETQFACQQYEAALKPTALALFGPA